MAEDKFRKCRYAEEIFQDPVKDYVNPKSKGCVCDFIGGGKKSGKAPFHAVSHGTEDGLQNAETRIQVSV